MKTSKFRSLLPVSRQSLTRRSALVGVAATALGVRKASANSFAYDPTFDPDPEAPPPNTRPLLEGPLFRPPTADPPEVPSDEEIRNILTERIHTGGKGIGIVVGIIEPQREGDFYYPRKRVVAEGTMGRFDPRPVDGNTIFEIGSISKVFTSLLLANMVTRNELSMQFPLELVLPPWVRVPRRNGKSITLAHLASHRSGLPRMPGNFRPLNERNPYADYSVSHAYKFLSSHKLEWDIDSRYVYSNFGAALLGHALAVRAGREYGELLQSRIFGPLGLGSTFIALPWQLRETFAGGHNDLLVPLDHWDFDFFSPAGGIRSNAEDMLLFLAHHLGYFESELTPAIGVMLSERWPASTPYVTVGLGWHVITRAPFAPTVTHDGMTGGFYSFVAYQPETGRAVVVLSNNANRMEDLGWHLLDRRHRLGA